MRILFSVRNPWYVRHYDSVLRRLAAQGHSIDLVADGLRKRRVWPASVEALAAECPAISLHWAPPVAGDGWFEFGTRTRQALYFMRFLRREYAGMPSLLARAEAKAPRWIVRLARLPLLGTYRGVACLERVLRSVERVVPPHPGLVGFVRDHRPDVLVVTPLIVLRTIQLDLLRAADALGIPTVLAVASWDHLSSKGIIWSVPDRVLVWNETQAGEAVRFHGVPRSSVRVTGAQLFDVWFARRANRTREEFCATVGLDPARPYILYVGSALFDGSPSEPLAAAAWVRAVRAAADRRVRTAPVLLRPHPRRAADWGDQAFDGMPDVTIHRPGLDAAEGPWRDDYNDSMRFAAAVVGINTSAMVEAAIHGRPVLSVLDPQWYPNQEGTIHFRYLIGEHGLIETSRSMDEHVRQLGAALAETPESPRSRRFVEHFVRPHGLAVEATAAVVREIEDAGRMTRPPAAAASFPVRLLRWLVAGLARRRRPPGRPRPV